MKRKIVKRINPRTRLRNLMNQWDDAVCSFGNLSEAERLAALIVKECTRQKMRPPVFPGSWRGFVQWCESRNVSGADALRGIAA